MQHSQGKKNNTSNNSNGVSKGDRDKMMNRTTSYDDAHLACFNNDAFRFVACLANAAEEAEAQRRFIVCFYLSDYTVAMAELTPVNGGSTVSKTFSRRAVASLHDPDVFRIGNVVTLDGLAYQLLDMDEHTR
uniref:EF-hand domain-containing family member C2 n=1 Tax=Lygus hesperus TaxID=30085 RepID=A0A0A9YDT4_LYGHE